eukprot:g18052.t1
MPAHKKQRSSRAVALLSATGLGGLCAASLAPLADGAAAVSRGPAGGANDAVRRQEFWSQERQQQHQERPLQNARRRPRTSSRKAEPDAAHADVVVPEGIFNSFSLAEREPSSYHSGMELLPQQEQETQRDHDCHHHQQPGGGLGRVAATASSASGAHHYDHEAYDSSSGEFSADEHQHESQRLSESEADPEFDAGGGPGGHYYHYYPGRGKKAAQNLARERDFGRFFYNAPAPSPYGHPHQLSFFTGGASPYGSSSASSSNISSSRRRRTGRRRSRGGLARPPLLAFSPAVVAAAAAAAAGVLIKITAAAGLAVAVLAPLAAALSSHWAYFVAGGICAAVSHTAAVPLDVIKTRIQCAPAGVEYRGTWDALVRICRSEGGRVLFCGAGATLVGYALQGSLKFGFFEFLKPIFSGLFGRGCADAATASTPFLGTLIAASVTAEIVGSSALTPLEAARIRMVADADYAPGLRSGIARMISEEGVGSLTRGLPAVLAKQVPYTVTKLVTFDYLVRTVASRFGSAAGGGGSRKGRVGAGVGVTVACAVIAGVLSSLASQPGDSLLSALNSEGRKDFVTGGGGGGGGGDVTDSASEEFEFEEEEEEEEVCSSEDQDGGAACPGFGVGGGTVSDGSGGRGGGIVAQEVEPVARAMLRIVGEIGLLGLFRGMGARMMHVTSIVTVQLLIYQSIKRMVGIES